MIARRTIVLTARGYAVLAIPKELTAAGYGLLGVATVGVGVNAEFRHLAAKDARYGLLSGSPVLGVPARHRHLHAVGDA